MEETFIGEPIGEPRWGWVLAGGIIFAILGMIAFLMPVASTVGISYGLGTILLIGGVVQLIHAFTMRPRRAGAARFVRAAVSIVGGALILRYPAAGMFGLAIALAFYFFISAVSQWVLAFSMGPFRGRGWVIVSSVASFLLGVYIVMTFPFSALWVPGTLLGIDLVIYGISMIGWSITMLGVQEKRVRHEEHEKPTISGKAA